MSQTSLFPIITWMQQFLRVLITIPPLNCIITQWYMTWCSWMHFDGLLFLSQASLLNFISCWYKLKPEEICKVGNVLDENRWYALGNGYTTKHAKLLVLGNLNQMYLKSSYWGYRERECQWIYPQVSQMRVCVCVCAWKDRSSGDHTLSVSSTYILEFTQRSPSPAVSRAFCNIFVQPLFLL